MFSVKTTVQTSSGCAVGYSWGPFSTHERAEELLLLLAKQPNVLSANIISTLTHAND